MKNIVQIIIDNNLANRVISVSQLDRLLNGTNQSRYNLVNRAIKKEELIRLLRGLFTFHPLPVHRLHFLEQVKRYQENKQTMLIAGPLRALMDLVCLRKLSWNGMAWLIEGIRIDPDLLSAVSPKEIQMLKLVYKHQRAQRFLDAMQRELGFTVFGEPVFLKVPLFRAAPA